MELLLGMSPLCFWRWSWSESINIGWICWCRIQFLHSCYLIHFFLTASMFLTHWCNIVTNDLIPHSLFLWASLFKCWRSWSSEMIHVDMTDSSVGRWHVTWYDPSPEPLSLKVWYTLVSDFSCEKYNLLANQSNKMSNFSALENGAGQFLLLFSGAKWLTGQIVFKIPVWHLIRSKVAVYRLA